MLRIITGSIFISVKPFGRNTFTDKGPMAMINCEEFLQTLPVAHQSLC